LRKAIRERGWRGGGGSWENLWGEKGKHGSPRTNPEGRKVAEGGSVEQYGTARWNGKGEKIGKTGG